MFSARGQPAYPNANHDNQGTQAQSQSTQQPFLRRNKQPLFSSDTIEVLQAERKAADALRKEKAALEAWKRANLQR